MVSLVGLLLIVKFNYWLLLINFKAKLSIRKGDSLALFFNNKKKGGLVVHPNKLMVLEIFICEIKIKNKKT